MNITMIEPTKKRVKKATSRDCSGCRDNFYNGNNDLGVKQCWGLESAYITKVKLVPSSMRPPWDMPYENKPSCYKRPGYASIHKERTK